MGESEWDKYMSTYLVVGTVLSLRCRISQQHNFCAWRAQNPEKKDMTVKLDI